jgi:hypothetical protein
LREAFDSLIHKTSSENDMNLAKFTYKRAEITRKKQNGEQKDMVQGWFLGSESHLLEANTEMLVQLPTACKISAVRMAKGSTRARKSKGNQTHGYDSI